MKHLQVFVFIFIQQCCFGQIPSIEWQRLYGGSYFDHPGCIQQTPDGGYIFVGFTNSGDGDVSGAHGKADLWLVKLSSTGSIQWQKCLGGTMSDAGYSIKQTSDGGYVLTGSSYSSDGNATLNHGGADLWVIKVSSAGALQWQQSYGGSEDEEAADIIQTTDGGYAVIGMTRSNDFDVSNFHGGMLDYWCIKIDASGLLQWQKAFGGSQDDFGKGVVQTVDGGYLFAGYSNSIDGDISNPPTNGGANYWLVKTDGAGNPEWDRSYANGLSDDRLFGISKTHDGGYILSGQSHSPNGYPNGPDLWLVKLDGSANIQWDKILGGSGDESTGLVKQTSDHGFIAVCASYSSDFDVTENFGQMDIWVAKTDSSGTLQWQKSLGGSQNDYPMAILQTTDQGYAVIAATYSDSIGPVPNHGEADILVVKLSKEPLPNAGELQSHEFLCLNDTMIITTTGDLSGFWESSDSSIVMPGPGGQLIGSGLGTATISYTVNGWSGYTPSVSTTTVTVIDPPFPGIISGVNEICVTQTFTMSSSGDNGGFWASSNDTVLNINVITGVITALSPGIATICYSFDASCADSASMTILVDDCAGINKLYESKLSVYPNPTLGLITINGTADLNHAAVSILNSVGQEVFRSSNEESTINYSFTVKGVYIVLLKDREGKLIDQQKIVVQ